MQELLLASEDWKVLKLVVLGHGRIGKTTMLHAMKTILENSQVVFILF
jgi:hypothetical protein